MKPPGFKVLKGIPVKQQPFRRKTNKLVNKRGNVNPIGWNEQNETSRNHHTYGQRNLPYWPKMMEIYGNYTFSTCSINIEPRGGKW